MRTPFNPLNPQSVSLIASYTLQAYIGAVFTFIELEPFARAREALLDDSELSKLQLHLMTRPEAGDVIPGAEGCRVAFLHPRSMGGVLVELTTGHGQERTDRG